MKGYFEHMWLSLRKIWISSQNIRTDSFWTRRLRTQSSGTRIHPMPDIWRPTSIPDVWCPLSDSRCPMSDLICPKSDVWYPVCYVWCLISQIWCMSDVRYSDVRAHANVRCLMSGLRRQGGSDTRSASSSPPPPLRASIAQKCANIATVVQAG